MCENSKVILVVDDEEDSREFFVQVLTKEGRILREASDGQEALTLIEEQGEPDLLITDRRMTQIHGDELVRRLRASKRTFPIIMISGDFAADDELREEMLRLDVTCLTKPVSNAALCWAVAQTLQ